MSDRRTAGQLVLSIGIAILAIAIALPALRRVPVEHSVPLVLAGFLLGTSTMRAELALRRRRR